MPAIEMPDASFHFSPTLERSLFRSHKNLPRSRDIGSPHVDVLQQIFSDRDAGPVNGPAIATAPALPLTPPVAAEEDDRSTESDPQMDGSIKSDRTIQALTPRTQRLLTPETTPPRAASSHRPDVSQPAQPLSSSRAESFRTACENTPSDAETETSYLSTRSFLQSSRLTAQAQRPLQENGHKTPASYSGGANTPRDQSSDSTRSVFNSPHERPMDTRRRDRRGEGPDVTPTPKDPFSNGDRQKRTRPADTSALDVQGSQFPQARGRSLRSRVRDVQNDKETPSVEQFGEKIGWPSLEDPSNPTDLPGSRRLSGVSTASTVEAIIIDSPTPVKPTLRHTEKRFSLRSASSPIPKSVRTPLASNADPHRLTHRVGRITDQDRRSVTSRLSDSGASTLGATRSNIEVVPVIVIPERRSSLRSSSVNSRDQSRTCSRGSSQRTTITPGSRTGSVDRSRRKTRAASDSTPRPSQGVDSRSGFSQPVIPPRSSSLSAPTSRNNSRAPSPTSESRRRHMAVVDPDAQKLETKRDVAESHNDPLNRKSHDSQGTRSGHLRVGSDETSELRSPSLPFTQGSIHSLSPGPVEINEATAVSFFPHNNRSLLLVDQYVVPESRAVQAVRESYRGKLDGLRTPDISSQALQVGVDSPLRNPRPPPQPPTVKVLPPTPSEELDRQTGEPTYFEGSNGAISRRFGSVRRALSARQRTNSSNSARRMFSTSAKNPRAEKVMDGKLHSFWLPRRFWDDSAETSPEDEASGEQKRENKQIINNSLGMPQQQRVFEGPCLPRRSPDMRRFADSSPVGHHPSRSQLIDGRVFSPDILRTGSPLHQRRFRSIRWLKLRFRPLRLRHLRKRMRRSVLRREEKKWEARRQNLKQSIGGIVHVDSSVNLNTAASK